MDSTDQPSALPPEGKDENRRLSDVFHVVLQQFAGKTVSVETLINALHERSFGVLLILFSLPLCIPVPKPPPIDTILGIPLFYLCLQMIAKEDTPKLPRKVLDYVLPINIMIKAFDRGRPWLEQFERLFRPRMTNVFSEHALSRICGILGMGLTMSVAVPFPLSNTVPSLCMVVMATALMKRDAPACIAAGVFGTLWVIGLAVAAYFSGHFIVSFF